MTHIVRFRKTEVFIKGTGLPGNTTLNVVNSLLKSTTTIPRSPLIKPIAPVRRKIKISRSVRACKDTKTVTFCTRSRMCDIMTSLTHRIHALVRSHSGIMNAIESTDTHGIDTESGRS